MGAARATAIGGAFFEPPMTIRFASLFPTTFATFLESSTKQGLRAFARGAR